MTIVSSTVSLTPMSVSWGLLAVFLWPFFISRVIVHIIFQACHLDNTELYPAFYSQIGLAQTINCVVNLFLKWRMRMHEKWVLSPCLEVPACMIPTLQVEWLKDTTTV